MIKKLRWKLTLYATASIFFFLLIILSTINLVNFGIVADEADEITAKIANNGGVYPQGPNKEGEGAPEEEDSHPVPASSDLSALSSYLDEGSGEGEKPSPTDPGGPGDPEMAESIRYFTISFDSAGNGTIVKKKIMDETVSDSAAITWASKLTGKEKGWTETYFRFRTYQYNNQTYVSVLYYDRELRPSYRVLNASIIGGLAGTVISFLVLIPLSSLFVKPLVASRKKQQRFISDASHELKTPLTIISANKEILEIEQGESEASKSIGKQVARLNNMVKNLNALANMDEGVKPLMGSFDLSRTCMEMLDAFQPAFEKKGIALESEIPETHPFTGDETMIRQLLSILLDNAAKYAKTSAEFHLYVKGDRTAIKVKNDADVPEGSLDRVFERFYRSEEARASGNEGSGIGLSLAMEIVKNCGGRISAKGENGYFIIKAEL